MPGFEFLISLKKLIGYGLVATVDHGTYYRFKTCVLSFQANQYFKNEEFVKAIKTYNEAINKFNRSAVLHGNRAAAYMKRAW